MMLATAGELAFEVSEVGIAETLYSADVISCGVSLAAT